MDGELPRSGHSYFGTVTSAQEAHAILEACKLGLLPRVTRRLTDEERLRFVRAGAVFVWEEEEAGIRRWTDHIKWSPSRVSGAFLTYTEVPAREDTLVKQSFSSVDASGTKMHLIAYTSKATAVTSSLPSAARDPLIQHMLAQRTSGGRDPRDRPAAAAIAAQPPSRPPDPLPRLAPSPTLAAVPPPKHPRRGHLHRSQSTLPDIEDAHRPQTSSSGEQSRPQTSASEPRPGSSYGAHHQHHPSSSISLSFPSLAHHSVASTPSSFPGPSAAHSFPPLAAAPAHWPFAYDAQHPSQRSSSLSRLSSQYASPAPTHSATFSPAPGWPPSTAPSTAGASATTASPFDPFPRQLPPLEQPAGLPMPAGDSPPVMFAPQGVFADEEGQGTDGEWRPPARQAGRGAEDERQLRLLGRSF
ncbi:Gluconate transport-inducing protein [Rhodotorula kratochvilovae]